MVEWAAEVASEEKQVTVCGGHQERKAHTVTSHDLYVFRKSVHFVLNSSNYCKVFRIFKFTQNFSNMFGLHIFKIVCLDNQSTKDTIFVTAKCNSEQHEFKII